MRLNTIIDDNLIEQARLATDMQSDREIIETALRSWLKLKPHQQKLENPAKALLESDFIGCGEADATLSVNYKQEFAKILNEKYDHN